MNVTDVIRAWTDPEYRETLDEATLASLPQHPAGMTVTEDPELDALAGGMPCNLTTYGTVCSKGWRCF